MQIPRLKIYFSFIHTLSSIIIFQIQNSFVEVKRIIQSNNAEALYGKDRKYFHKLSTYLPKAFFQFIL